ncbi:MAG: hypothetical protein HDT41_01850 [Lachnospiraceae bacterium]|nr:hypothetical protein [Lachnospiraceae bacterium]
MKEKGIEELSDLPEEWIKLVKTIPNLYDVFVEDKGLDMGEMLPVGFLSYFQDDYKECEPFFTCFEGGWEVFHNFYNIYGKDFDSCEEEKLSDGDIRELMKKHMKGMNSLLELCADGDSYDADSMEIKILPSIEEAEEFVSDWEDWEEVECADIRQEIMNVVIDMLPDEEENPISAFWEPLYEQTQDYHILAYIMWPLMKRADIENPFEAYKMLWEHDITIYCKDKELLAVRRK